MNKSLFDKAEKVGQSKTKLKKRLLEARSVLRDEYRTKFKIYSFDFEAKRLYSEDLSYALQWQNNGKTSRGSVVCLEIGY